MNQQDYILSIDHGTQSVRAILFDLQGNIAVRSRVPIQPYYSTEPGWAEQDPEYFWKSLAQACCQLWQKTDIPKEAVRGVTLTTQRATVINVDASGKPLRPAMVWLDQRVTKGIKPIGGLWGGLFKLGRLEKDIARLQSETEVNWIKVNQPEIWQETYKYLLLSGYLSYRLTGNFLDSTGNQVGYIPFSVKKMDWAGPRHWSWQAFPVERQQLPELLPPGALLGQVTPEAAEETGIPVGLPVIAAASDKACELVGNGALEPHIACLSFGTNATLNTMQPKYLEVIPPLPPYPAAIPGAYNPEIAVNRGFWMVSWFKKEFAHYEQQIAAEKGIEAEELFDELVNQVPAGSMGLVLQPYWMPSFKAQGPEAKGAIIGFGEIHTRAHLYRAILEGLAYALLEGKEKTEKRSHIPITEVRVSGGGASSQAALQITADVFGLPVYRAHTYETSALGAAIVAAVGLHLYPDFKTAVKAMSRLEAVYTPDSQRHEIYSQLYKRVYLEMYSRLQPLYSDIQKITGYP
ncbi:MAG TPA: FGGY-family carbohydrate kinase [Chloroflexia bacterium]|nr:FGGY-family carbohydrate kinase [Chloroflexia bacterium]